MASLLPSLWTRSAGIDPFRAMQRQMDEMFRNFGNDQSLDVGASSPPLNVAETADRIEVTAELPGMDEKDIKVSVDGNRLVISGEKKTETDNKDKEWHVVERSWGAFHRSVALPFEPAVDAITAHYDKGVLHLRVQKPAAKVTTAKTIPVMSGAPKAEEPPKVQ